MLTKALREIVILIGCLLIFPLVQIVLLTQTHSLRTALVLVAQELYLGFFIGTHERFLALCIKLISPYLIVQAIRAYRMAHRGVSGRRWTNLYFSAVATLVATWAFWSAWDMFYLMYALGDIPAELGQFVQLEWDKVLIFIVSSICALYSFYTFLNPDSGEQWTDQVDRPQNQ